MSAAIDSQGDIESICEADSLTAGDTARLVFRSWETVNPPFRVKVRDPDGKMILERVIRQLPTGEPQSAPPVTFTVANAGDYQVSIVELYGKVEGSATLHVKESAPASS